MSNDRPLTSAGMTRVMPQTGVLNPDNPLAVLLLDCPCMDMARQVSSIIMKYQNGKQTLSGGPVFYNDTNIMVEILTGPERPLVQVYPVSGPGHLTHPVVWTASVEGMGWDLFSIYFRRARQFSLSVSVDLCPPQELPTLVKFNLVTRSIQTGR